MSRVGEPPLRRASSMDMNKPLERAFGPDGVLATDDRVSSPTPKHGPQSPQSVISTFEAYWVLIFG